MNPKGLYYQVHGVKAPRRPARVRKNGKGPARSWRYRAWIRTLPSVVSGKMGCEACHTQNNGMRSKGSCYTCVPLTRAEHIEYDKNRQAFEEKYGISMAERVKYLNSVWKLGKEEAA